MESQNHQHVQQAKSALDALLKRAKAGDQGAEAELFRTLSLRFTAIAKRRIREKEAAEDIAQDACTTILQKYKTETFTVSFAAWAFGVLWMKIGNHLQSSKAQQERLFFDPAPDRHATTRTDDTQIDLKRQLQDCLRKLARIKPRYVRALNLRYQGFTTEEICKRMKVTAGNLYWLLSKGRFLLKKCLETGKVG